MKKITRLSMLLLLTSARLPAQALPADSPGEYACLWLDNTGASAFEPPGIGRGTVAGDSVAFVFHYTQTDGFHTTFVYSRATDSWQWHMDNDSAGVRRPFARVTLTRR